MNAISLFVSGGIADLALEANGLEVILANELVPDRASVYKHNFPKCEVFVGDINKLQNQIISKAKELLDGDELDFLIATPPCQGMSKNGKGFLLKLIREGRRPKIDPRNRLIIPTLKIIKSLRPMTVIFENVPEMRNTIIDDDNGNYVNIVEYIEKELIEYTGRAQVIQFADYGVPQRRSRLITVFSRDVNLKTYFQLNGTFLPAPTHSLSPKKGLERWITVRDIIGNLPALDAKNKKSANSDIPFHYVSVLDKKKYFWISNTPSEKSAFDNQCINSDCMYTKNPVHGSERNGDGVNRAKTTTPLYCIGCGSLLPRPYVEKVNQFRIMNGYTSSYKRMRWDLPSPTLTTNLSYPSSDHKLHPEQNRVLSLFEAFKLHTVDQYDYLWFKSDGNEAPNTLIRDIIGESIPPKGLEIIIKHLLDIKNEMIKGFKQEQLHLVEFLPSDYTY